MTGPLSGIRVLEVGHMLAGPFGGMMLADLGADVIKIEPAAGDLSRGRDPTACPRAREPARQAAGRAFVSRP